MITPGSVNPLLMAGGRETTPCGGSAPVIPTNGYVIKNSLRFRGGQWLNRASTGPAHMAVTLSFWVKRGKISAHQCLIYSRTGGAIAGLMFRDIDTLYFQASSASADVQTQASYRDPSAWYHVILSYDSVSACNIYVNGVKQAATGTASGQTSFMQPGMYNSIGMYGDTQQYFSDCYMADIHFIDGQALDASSFGEFDSFNGVWQPKAYAGTYGANGFWLKFDDAAQIGKDSSGNNNHWTANNIDVAAPGTQATYDLMKDSPVMFDDGTANPPGNYCTLNAVKAGTSTLSNGNLTAAGATVEPTIQPTSDTWYFEVDGAAKTWTPPAAFPAGGTNYNFGQRPFTNTPTGKILCTTNLPTPSITNGKQHFDIALGAGAGILAQAQALKAHDLIWIKDRANSNNHQLIDVVRGANALHSNDTSVESAYAAPAGNSVAWGWARSKCAGFDIVQYTGTGGSQTISHGLGATPDMIILKQIDGSAKNWMVYHKDILGSFLTLNLTSGKVASDGSTGLTWTSTNFTVTGSSDGVDSANGVSGRKYIAYCFALIPGMSAFGSYTGSADGPFVYLGFKPKFLVVKRADGAGSWQIKDTSRNAGNLADLTLFANLPSGENNLYYFYDLLSNGFKVRGTDAELNGSGSTYIYAAFASNPFKISLAQ